MKGEQVRWSSTEKNVSWRQRCYYMAIHQTSGSNVHRWVFSGNLKAQKEVLPHINRTQEV